LKIRIRRRLTLSPAATEVLKFKSGANPMKSKMNVLIASAAVASLCVATLLLGQDLPPAATPARPAAVAGKPELTILSLKKADASTTAEQLKELLSGAKDLKIIADTRTNQVLLSGSAKDIEMAEMLAKSLDSVETQQQPIANQFQLFAPANPFGGAGNAGGAAVGNTRPEQKRLDDQIATAQKHAESTAATIKKLSDQLAAAQAKAGDHGDGIKIDIEELKAQLAAAEREHAAIEDRLKDLADQRQANAGGGGGGRGGFGGGGFGAQAAPGFGGLFGGAGGGGGGGAGGFNGGGGWAGGGAAQFQVQGGGVPGQAEAVIVDGNNVTRLVVPANGLPATISTTTVQQRQAEQRINALANRLRALKKNERPTDDEKDEVAKATAELRDSLDAQFNETQKAQFDEVAKLRERLDNLQKEITDRSRNREEFLSQRLEDILSGKAAIPATPAAAGRRAGVAAVKAVPLVPAPVNAVPVAPAAANPFGAAPAGVAVPAAPPAVAPPAGAADADAPPGATKR